MLNTTNSDTGHQALEESRRMFHRVLSSWAIDLVALRASGLDKPSARAGLWSSAKYQDTYQQNRKAA